MRTATILQSNATLETIKKWLFSNFLGALQLSIGTSVLAILRPPLGCQCRIVTKGTRRATAPCT
jgi:hypothetical protein